MATIIKRNGKKGVSYLIRSYSGYYSNGRQIEKTMTWKPEPGMTPRQIEKAVNEQAVLFEKKVREGKYIDSNIRFSDFVDRWWKDYVEKELAPKTREAYQNHLSRINQAIGHIRLDKLQPCHLLSFYDNLSEEGIKTFHDRATAKPALLTAINSKNLTNIKLAKMTGLCSNTITSARQGKKIALPSAKAIAETLDMEFDKLFILHNDNNTLSAKTRSNYHRLISTILQTAVNWQVISDNPSRRVKAPKLDKKEAKYLEDTEAIQLVEALNQEPLKWRVIITVLLISGMRRSELCGLEWSDIDSKNNIIHIRRSSQFTSEYGLIEKDTKNESSERVIKLQPDLFDLLKSYKAWQIEERLKQGDRWYDIIQIKDKEGKIRAKKNERLFTQENGLTINPDSITGWVTKFRGKHDLPKFTPHTLRHTNVSLMIAAGVDLRTVSERAGHAQVTTTINLYAHAIKTANEKAAQAIGAVIKLK